MQYSVQDTVEALTASSVDSGSSTKLTQLSESAQNQSGELRTEKKVCVRE